MEKIILKTYPFVEKFIKDEIKNFCNPNLAIQINKIKEGEFEIAFNESNVDTNIKYTNEQIGEFLTNILYYSRIIKQVYTIKEDTKTKSEIDLFNFKLNVREYKLNNNKNKYIDPILVNYCLYLLEIDKINLEKEKFSIIDPISSQGDIIIEGALFNPRCPINVRKRQNLPFVKLLKIRTKLPINKIDKNKYIGIVQENKSFKHMKENLNFLNTKIKMSLYNLDWLDVKFKKEEIDFVFSYLPSSHSTKTSSFKNEEEKNKFHKEFFYQSEFICKNKISIICKNKIDNNILDEYDLITKYIEKIELNENQQYFIYIISKK